MEQAFARQPRKPVRLRPLTDCESAGNRLLNRRSSKRASQQFRVVSHRHPVALRPSFTSIKESEWLTSFCEHCAQRFAFGEHIVNINGRRWHQRCFVCVKCLQSLSSQNIHEFERRFYCEKDFLDLFVKKCDICGKNQLDSEVSNISTSFFQDPCLHTSLRASKMTPINDSNDVDQEDGGGASASGDDKRMKVVCDDLCRLRINDNSHCVTDSVSNFPKANNTCKEQSKDTKKPKKNHITKIFSLISSQSSKRKSLN